MRIRSIVVERHEYVHPPRRPAAAADIVEAANVVEAHDVVGMGVGEDHGVDGVDAVGDAL